MTYTVSSGTLNLTQLNPFLIFDIRALWRSDQYGTEPLDAPVINHT